MYDDFKVKSLAKAMEVLECFSIKTPELGITEIASALKLQKATVYNILATFEKLGYVEQSRTNSKYHLSLRMLRFGYIVNAHLDYRTVFKPYMQKLATVCNEVGYLAVPYDREVLYLDSVSPRTAVPDRLISGEHAPMHCTGLGKVLLAFMPEEERNATLSLPMTKHTECTITDPAVMLSELIEIKARGYAVDNMEHEYGVTCVAVPIFGLSGEPVAAVSVSGPTPRFSAGRIEELAGILKEILGPLQNTL